MLKHSLTARPGRGARSRPAARWRRSTSARRRRSAAFPEGGIYANQPTHRDASNGRTATRRRADIGWRDFFADARLQQLVGSR